MARYAARLMEAQIDALVPARGLLATTRLEARNLSAHGQEDERRRQKRGRQNNGNESARILIVEARFYDDIADALLAGATRVLDEAGATYDLITVPGALEIPAAIAMAVDAPPSASPTTAWSRSAA